MRTETKYLISIGFAGPSAHWDKAEGRWKKTWLSSEMASRFDTRDEALCAAIHVQRQFPDVAVAIEAVSTPAPPRWYERMILRVLAALKETP